MKSERGREILAYAMQETPCVLEFDENESGDVMVADITDHVNQLEEIIDK